jgi:alpha-tubulin suppressor-like RCC1 family protein
MAITQLQATSIADGAITTEKFSGDVSLSIKVSNVAISNSTYTVLDDTAVNVGGGYIVITGAGFQSGAQVLINRDEATSVSFVDSTTLRAQVPAKTAGTYNLYVVNPDGGTAIRVNGLTYSGIPTWVTASTLDNQAVDVAFNVAFDATGATSYANTTTLPAGTALLSNGYFYGTVTGIEEETTYNFTVAAIDDELQDSPRTFQVTVTVGPPAFTMYSIGTDSYGSFGLNNGTTSYRSSPVQVASDKLWLVASGGYGNTIAVKDDGTLWTWGYNTNGELGINDRINRSSPVQVGSLTSWVYCAASNTVRAFKSDGTKWAWGSNQFGYHGDNTTASRSSPVQIGGTDWNYSKFTYDSSNVGHIKSDGSLWIWGRGEAGQLGTNTGTGGGTFYVASPNQVSGTWTDISINASVAFGIKSNGTLWLWGKDSYGVSGLNSSTTQYRSSPVQLGTGTNWAKISIQNGRTAHALKTDGTLWCWGFNNNGEIGNSSRVNISSPIQIGTNTDWYKIAPQYFGTGLFVSKTDGTLWSWGFNNVGQLGLNTITSRSSPTQVGAENTWNKELSLGQYNRRILLKT